MTRYLPIFLPALGLIAVLLFGVPEGGLLQRSTPTVVADPPPLEEFHVALDELRGQNEQLRQEIASLQALPERVASAELRLKAHSADLASALHAYPIPDRLAFCGEEVPLQDASVRVRFENEWNRFLVNRHWVVSWMRRSRDVFPVVEARLAAAGMPDDLKYVMTIESAVDARAYSSAGAVGYWQFIRDTGKRYGLNRTTLVDERRDLERATDAAIAYLSELHEEFGSWALALSAYNAGERRVRTEVEAQGTDDYFQMILPKETEAYVFKAAAVKVLFQDPERYGFVLPDDGWTREAYDSIQITVGRQLDFKDLAAAAGLTYRQLKDLNPQYRTSHLTKGTYPVVLPRRSVAGVLERYASAEVIARDRTFAETPPAVDAVSAPDQSTAPPR